MATPPTLSPEQREAALKKAAEARKAFAVVKEKLKMGSLTLNEALDRADSDDAIGRLKVVTFLESLPGVGKVKARRLMEEIGIAENRRVKGLGEQRVLWRHILPNALLPVVTFIGLDLAGMFGGAIITESIFNLPGLGQFMFQAIKLKEGGVVVLLSTLAFISFIVINLLVDVLYGVVDPRVRNV